MRHVLFAVAVAAALPGIDPPGSPPGSTGPIAAPELVQRPYLYEVMRYLYRWHLDEHDLDALIGRREFTFQIRMLRPALDPDDHSQFAELLLPQLGMSVRLKRADYQIPELGKAVHSGAFKVVGVARVDRSDSAAPDFVAVTVDYSDMRDHLFRTRRDAPTPEGELLMRMRRATRAELARNAVGPARQESGAVQIVHLAPLSPVANEAWVYWETGRRLIRFGSDVDLADPAVWEHEELTVRMFDIDAQVVVSLDEAAGSNAYLTRDQVGRALFNCMVLGRRLELEPLAAKDVPGSPAPADR